MWDAGQLVRGSVVRFLRARNQQGYDIYLLPYAEQCNAGYILIDLDHATADVLPRMRANGHEPCVVLQSSPGHLQAWIRVSTTPLEPALATAISKRLARTYGGDLASTDGYHLGRLAGFTNQKLQRRTARGYAPWVKIVEARAAIARAAPELLHLATQLIAQQSAAVRDTTYCLPRVGNPSTTITAHGAARIIKAGRNVGVFGSAFLSRTGASSICGWLENCWPCTYRQSRWKLFSVWEVQIFPATTALRKTICVALWHALLFLLSALCVRLIPLLLSCHATQPTATARTPAPDDSPAPVFSCFVPERRFPQKNFAPRSLKSDDPQLGRPTASPGFGFFRTFIRLQSPNVKPAPCLLECLPNRRRLLELHRRTVAKR